jgi:hypothetical protein
VGPLCGARRFGRRREPCRQAGSINDSATFFACRKFESLNYSNFELKLNFLAREPLMIVHVLAKKRKFLIFSILDFFSVFPKCTCLLVFRMLRTVFLYLFQLFLCVVVFK